VTVRYKPEYGFSPKNYREREIPIPAKLCVALKRRAKTKAKDCGLVFPTSGCKAQDEFFGRSESNGGTCEAETGCVLSAQVPSNVRNVVAVGRSRSADGAAVAGSLRHGKHDAPLETVAQSTGKGKSERDFRVGTLKTRHSSPRVFGNFLFGHNVICRFRRFCLR
jgi:hypothetical protein